MEVPIVIYTSVGGDCMAQKKMIARLNEKLIEGKVIEKRYEKDYPLVQKKMNSIIKKTGKVLSDVIFDKGDRAMRDWLLRLYKQGASQEKLTSYLRCALAHLSFDFIESTYRQISPDDLITRALQSFKKRKFHKSFFRVPASEVVKKKAIKKRESGKTVVKKKSSGKVPKKKSVGKKTAQKKITASRSIKKTSSEKATAKKAVSKKSTAVKKSQKKS